MLSQDVLAVGTETQLPEAAILWMLGLWLGFGVRRSGGVLAEGVLDHAAGHKQHDHRNYSRASVPIRHVE
jgi:hypothetical protein